MSIESVIPIAWDVLKHLGVTFKRQFEYVMRSKRYAKDLGKEVEKLKYEADRVQGDKENAENNLLSIHGWVPEFLASAEKALTEAGDLLSNFEMASKTCCYGTFPDPNCRHTFSRMAKHQTDYIKNLVQDYSKREVALRGRAPGNVSAQTPAEGEGKDVIPLTNAAAASSALMSMELQDGGIGKSREPIIREIMAALADKSNSVVGVHGMGGVGKSTLAEEVKRKLSEENLFDWVTMADVSENPDINRIQGKIAYALNLDMKNEANVDVRAELLRTRLEKEVKAKKRVLIILDNLWERLDLKSVGIPCGLDKKVRGCKLLLTSRRQDVLRREMGSDRDFRLDGLQEVEAKELFKRMVGDKVHDSEFKPLADRALHICAGLPFLIIAIANVFKDANLSECEDALYQIEMLTNKGISEVINSTLQLSYDRFKAEEANELKLLLRLCTVYGVSEPSLENLMRYGMGLGLFGEGCSIGYARNRLSTLIHTLQQSSFLLHKGEDGFGIHDLVRGFVTWVASRDDPFLVLKDNDKLVAKLPRDKLKSCTAICLPCVDMELPKELDCPELQIFLLFTNNESLEVPPSFFASLRKLKVLNVTGIDLPSWPSFPLSEKLCTLCLEGGLQPRVTIIGKLHHLQILSFVNSKIERLPKEIGWLTELRLLDLNYCLQLHIIEPGVLSGLINLEELYMERSFEQWNIVDQTPPTNASLIELNYMKNLCTLDISIPDPSMLPGDMNIQKLTKYKIRIGHFDIWRFRHWSSKYKASRTMILHLNPPSDILKKECMRTTLDRIQALLLGGLCGNEQSICALSREGFPELKHLQVYSSPSIHYILQCYSHIAFKTLESLILKNLLNLEKICHSDISSESFSTLKVLRVKSCDNMKVLFPSSVVRGLPKLEEIVVVGCKLMRWIVEVDDYCKVELHNLRVLILRDLPDIKNFFNVGSAPSSSTLEDKVSTQIAFFNGQQVAFQRLETLEISGLDNIRFIFLSSMVESLTQLKKLTVSDCENTEAIIMEEEGLEMQTSKILAFPMLTHLHLEWLKSLTRFSRGKCARVSQNQDHVRSHTIVLFNQEDSRYIRHLQTLDMSHCDGLSNMFTPTTTKYLVALTKLRISNCRILTEVVSDEEGGEGCVVAFNQLKYMELDGLIGLRSFSSGGCTLMFPLLEDVIVTRCPNMKVFSQGHIEASKLERVQVSKASFWVKNLNITIQNMFEAMATLSGVKKMLLSEFPELIGKWHNELNPIKLDWQLQSMVVDKCPSFVNAIPSNLMLLLNNLSFLQVHDCELLEEIFDLERLKGMESTRVLPQLWQLSLANLPKLRRLWNKDLQESIHFDSLRFLILYNCSNLGHAFASSMARCLANLEHMEIKKCCQMEEVIVEEEGQGSTVEKITFPKLQQMKLECLPNLTCLLLGKNHTLECSILVVLSIAHCPKMRSLTRQSWMENDHNNPSLFTPQVQFPQLRSMVFSHMNSLRKIWTDGPQETLIFNYLRKVEVQNCKSIEHLFPHWVATSLTQLEELQVESCEIEEIVASGDDTPHSNATQILFPKLTSLVLHDMPQLQSISLNLPPLNWQFLKELQVSRYDKLKMLSFVASKNNWAQRDDQQDLLEPEAHSSFERDFPNLERLLLVNDNIQMIQNRNFPDDIFSKLKALTLACFDAKNTIFPPIFLLERFQNLQSLEVFCSSFEDMFPDEGLVDEGRHLVLENLRELKLNKLHNLKSVQSSLMLKILRSIKIFKVWDCPCLKTIFPDATSFQNLRSLEVKNSSGLANLVIASMVTNLVHLTSMTIIGCERMKEIVTNDKNREGKMISLGNLEELILQHLPSLECFSSIPSCSFRFPSLRIIKVEECPKMKTFSDGMLRTPRLYMVTLFRYKWEGYWEKEGDDLNTTIQKLSA